MTPLSRWTLEVAKIGENGRIGSFVANGEERQELARVLDIVTCDGLEAEYSVSQFGRARYRLRGTLVAKLTQACVVTLDPVATEVEEPFDVEFWPHDQIPVCTANESDVLTTRDPEPIVGGVIEIGRIVFEHLSAAMDPFPRKEGASLDRLLAENEQGAPLAGPFATLMRLKQGSS